MPLTITSGDHTLNFYNPWRNKQIWEYFNCNPWAGRCSSSGWIAQCSMETQRSKLCLLGHGFCRLWNLPSWASGLRCLLLPLYHVCRALFWPAGGVLLRPSCHSHPIIHLNVSDLQLGEMALHLLDHRGRRRRGREVEPLLGRRSRAVLRAHLSSHILSSQDHRRIHGPSIHGTVGLLICMFIPIISKKKEKTSRTLVGTEWTCAKNMNSLAYKWWCGAIAGIKQQSWSAYTDFQYFVNRTSYSMIISPRAPH